MVSFAKSFAGRLLMMALTFVVALIAITSTAEARCCHRKHPMRAFLGRLLLVLMCCGVAFASAAPALAGFGHQVHGLAVRQKVVVQQVRVRQPIVRQRVVVQQVVAQPLVYAQPIVAQQFYAQPLVQQQAFYAQPLVQQQLVQPSCGGGGLQLRQNFSGGGCSSFFAK